MTVRLSVGLSGGIGSGKSTAARRFAERGAVVIDADLLARDVVAAGTPGLDAVVAAFGPGVLADDGTLDRPALADVVFGDVVARRRLNAIVHPLVRARTAELTNGAPDEAVVVNDVPLLAETGLAPTYHLVVVVYAPIAQRIDRLVRDRGMTEADARDRIAAQAADHERRAAADVVLDNDGVTADLHAQVDRIWDDRLAPYADNLQHRRRVSPSMAVIVPSDPDWPHQYERLAARIRHAVGGAHGITIDHIGSTAVPGLAAKDVIDLQLGVESLEQADALRPALEEAGFPAVPGLSDRAKPPDHGTWPKRFHGSADPGRTTNLHLRVVGSPGWRYALLVRDWLRADPAERAAYQDLKLSLTRTRPDTGAYAQAMEPWFDAAAPRAEAWAHLTGWQPLLAR